jgi:exosortase A-associated hydrolase 1
MSRRHLVFTCEGSQLVGTLDHAAAATGLLIVSGGNELRSGAWCGQARFAARIAQAGFPAFRFDRRGIGDSEGGNGEFRSSGPDIAAALAAFREAAPQLTRVVALGNCDAASALMLGQGAGCDALVLSNPWTFEDEDGTPPPAVVRAHYRRRLGSWDAVKRLLTGRVSPRKLIAGLIAAGRPAPAPSTLAHEMARGLASFAGPVTILIAERDRTAQAFLAAWDARDERIIRCPQATHSYVEPEAFAWLEEQVLKVLRAVQRPAEFGN